MKSVVLSRVGEGGESLGRGHGAWGVPLPDGESTGFLISKPHLKHAVCSIGSNASPHTDRRGVRRVSACVVNEFSRM